MAVTILYCRCRVAGGRVNVIFFFQIGQFNGFIAGIVNVIVCRECDAMTPRTLTFGSRLVAFSFIQ